MRISVNVVDEWPASVFARELREREKVVVLFYGKWCKHSRDFLPLFDAAEPEANVAFVRADLTRDDARWDAHNIEIVPTLVYFEHGEELERVDGLRGRGLSPSDLEEFLATVDGIQEEPVLPKRMHGPRRS